jgi:hypothetical protein
MPERILALSLLAVVLYVPAAASADDLFGITASSSTTTVKAGSSSLIGLVENLSNTNNQFTPLQNQNFNSSLNYAGIKNAFLINQSFDTADHRIINFQVPSVGINQTFSSANGSLSTQIRDYLKKDGLADLSAFQAVVDQQSAAGVVDGNPLAATALLADAGYHEFALHPSPFDLNGKTFSTDGGHVVNRVWAEGGVLDAGGTSGSYVNLTLATELHFNDVLGLSFTTPLRYQTLHSADIFMGGEVVGLPITIPFGKNSPVYWQITPAGHAAMVGSQDLVNGGLIYGAQIDSSFNFSVQGLTFTIADEAGWFHGANLDIAGYDFNTHVDQYLFKNGLQVTKSFGNFFVDGSGTWSNFLHNTYVNGYFTPEVGVGFKFGPHDSAGFRIGYSGNFGDHYSTNGGNILLYFTR